MPYIEDHVKRGALDNAVQDLSVDDLDAGEMNYLLTAIVQQWALRNGRFGYEDSVHDVVGLLECVKLEWYTQPCAAYEALKRTLNGDVFGPVRADIHRQYDRARTTPDHVSERVTHHHHD